MAEVLSLEGMDDAIEEDYTQYAFEMRDGAIEIVEAVKLQNYDKAVAGVGVIRRRVPTATTGSGIRPQSGRKVRHRMVQGMEVAVGFRTSVT